MVSILVIGCVSSDIIHLQNEGPLQTFSTTGGAGLFTALAAAQAGAAVTLYAPKPKYLSTAFIAVDKKINWIGPEVTPELMPTLEITHHGEGRATLQNAGWGAEQLLTPADMKETLLSSIKVGAERNYDAIHIGALSSASRQISFAQFCQDEYPSGILSAGTYARSISSDRQAVKKLTQKCSLFFMNSNEAQILYQDQIIKPAAKQLIFVTDGKNGCSIYSHEKMYSVAAAKAFELDPTGAGDTFCGATLAAIAQGRELLPAVQTASILAAKVIEYPGCSFYLHDQ